MGAAPKWPKMGYVGHDPEMASLSIKYMCQSVPKRARPRFLKHGAPKLLVGTSPRNASSAVARARRILGAHVVAVHRRHGPHVRKRVGAASDLIGIVGIDRWTSLERARSRRTLETFALFLLRCGE